MSLAWCKKQKTEPVTLGRDLATSQTAQISAFILLGIVVILVLGAALVLLSGLSSSSFESSSLSPQNFVDACYKKAVECALAEVGSMSVLPPSPLSEVQGRAVELIRGRSLACFEGFSQFQQQGISIKNEGVYPSVEFQPQSVIIRINHDIKQEEEGKVKKLQQYTTPIPVRFQQLYTAAYAVSPLGREYIPTRVALDGVNVSVWPPEGFS